MDLGLESTVGLLSIIFFVLPGLAGIKFGLRIAGRGHWLDRLETVALSFALSLASMIILYLIVSGFQSYRVWRLELLTYESIVNILDSIPVVIGFYIVLIAISGVGGAILGYTDFGSQHFEPILPWARFHNLAEKSGDGETYVMRVRTTAGDEIRGKVEDEGEAALNKDIILENPRRLRLSDQGEVVDDSSWSGHAYIHSQSIAHVEFDRLEDADGYEIRAMSRDDQSTLQESTDEEEQEEMDELEQFAEEADESAEQSDKTSDEEEN